MSSRATYHSMTTPNLLNEILWQQRVKMGHTEVHDIVSDVKHQEMGVCEHWMRVTTLYSYKNSFADNS